MYILGHTHKVDHRYLDYRNIGYRYDGTPLVTSISRFARFPLKTSYELGQPRLLLVSTDVKEGTAVTFDGCAYLPTYLGKSEVKNMDMIVKELEAIPESEAEEINE